MPIVINKKYKKVVERVKTYDVSPFNKAVLVLEEMCEAKDEGGNCLFDDYATIAKAVIETFLDKEI